MAWPEGLSGSQDTVQQRPPAGIRRAAILGETHGMALAVRVDGDRPAGDIDADRFLAGRLRGREECAGSERRFQRRARRAGCRIHFMPLRDAGVSAAARCRDFHGVSDDGWWEHAWLSAGEDRCQTPFSAGKWYLTPVFGGQRLAVALFVHRQL